MVETMEKTNDIRNSHLITDEIVQTNIRVKKYFDLIQKNAINPPQMKNLIK